jgi:hypothetical protein
MATYGKFEKSIAKVLESTPWIRNSIKFIYKRAVYVVSRKRYFRYSSPNNTLKSPYELVGMVMNQDENLFFGYYDRSPWNSSMTKLIYHSYLEPNQEAVDLKLFDLKSNKVKVIASSIAWNFQQGSMTQWVDDETIIFNDIKKNVLGSRVLNVRDLSEKFINYPMQCLRPDGKEFVSLNYKRLMRLRPDYGYSNEVVNFTNKMDYTEDGLWRIDISSGKADLFLSIDYLMKNCPTKEMLTSDNKVNHVMYSHDGNKIIFMHRWIGKDGKWSRLYVYDFDSKELKILLDDRMVSHYSWRNNREIITWARHKGKDGYYLVNIQTGVVTILDSKFNVFGDGHPSVSPLNENLFISDSYPDKGRVRHLFIGNLNTKDKNKIGSFFSPWRFEDQRRCDLHPRWSLDGCNLSIDSAHNGRRNSYVITNLK